MISPDQILESYTPMGKLLINSQRSGGQIYSSEKPFFWDTNQPKLHRFNVGIATLTRMVTGYDIAVLGAKTFDF